MAVSKNRRKNGKKATRQPAATARQKQPDANVPADLSVGQLKAMEQLMATLRRGLAAPDFGSDDASTALNAAQDLVYEAWEASTRQQRVKLAKQALKISELCADAWLVLAEETAGNTAVQRDYLEKAVAAGQAAIHQTVGPHAFEQEAGHFWSILETRPYMRARVALAESLWDSNERQQAVAHWQDLLRLCPNDNLGIRYILGSKLLELDQLAEARDLLEAYDEPDSAEWSYSFALLQFKLAGASQSAAKALAAAINTNPHVPDYLLGVRRLPETPPPYYELGSDGEAVIYLLSGFNAWRSTTGALEWIGGVVTSIGDAKRH